MQVLYGSLSLLCQPSLQFEYISPTEIRVVRNKHQMASVLKLDVNCFFFY